MDRQMLLQDRIADLIGNCSPGNQFNDADSSDVRLTLSSKDGLSVTLCVHRHILVAHSRFFAAKLSDRWSKQQRTLPHIVEISDCDDVEVYAETLRLMYCKDLRRRLMREDVNKVLGILKVPRPSLPSHVCRFRGTIFPFLHTDLFICSFTRCPRPLYSMPGCCLAWSTWRLRRGLRMMMRRWLHC
jgi:hypothetical protein